MPIKGIHSLEQHLRQDGEGNRCCPRLLRLTLDCCQPRVLHLSCANIIRLVMRGVRVKRITFFLVAPLLNIPPKGDSDAEDNWGIMSSQALVDLMEKAVDLLCNKILQT